MKNELIMVHARAYFFKAVAKLAAEKSPKD